MVAFTPFGRTVSSFPSLARSASLSEKLPLPAGCRLSKVSARPIVEESKADLQGGVGKLESSSTSITVLVPCHACM